MSNEIILTTGSTLADYNTAIVNLENSAGISRVEVTSFVMKNDDQVPTKIVVQHVFTTVEGELDSIDKPNDIFIPVSPPTPDTLSLSDDSEETSVTSISREVVSKRSLGIENPGQIKNWCGRKYFSELVRDGLEYIEAGSGKDVVMIFECPSSACAETSFHNVNMYKIHDYPPTPFQYKSVMRPLRYAAMNGDIFPAYLMSPANETLMHHWERTIPNFCRPSFVHSIDPTSKVNAYLPMENSPGRHINDPDLHYYIAGKDAIRQMTDKTTKLLPNTKDVRPCIVKVTHAMGSVGIFVINTDEDETKFLEFVATTGNPTYVVTELVDIAKNLSCHFFMHPSGEIVWFGSSENLLLPDGRWSSDSTMEMDKQQEYQDLMAPYVRDVARYCLSKGFWGFSGIDVLFNHEGVGFVVDMNPRVTGTMPALMLATHMQDTYGLTVGKFRKSTKYAFPGSVEELVARVEEYNNENIGEGRITLFSVYEKSPMLTQLNIAIYGKSHEQCEGLLEDFTVVMKK